ncbi:DUF3175 domain-containing protein [Paraburkholderia sacchari]|uniref:DUF3175 domain-containing protein n=1 Tax=Paraburkholderia sacchari TaxID=159450 RepID=UPI0039A4424E
MATKPHPSTRTRNGKPARQRHAHASAAKKATSTSGTSGTSVTSSGSGRRWSHRVAETSDAMDLDSGVFKLDDPAAIARSLKQSSERSRRRKGTPFQSAMSMLNFYINRAGRNLPKSRRDTLQRAKGKLREAFGRKP